MMKLNIQMFASTNKTANYELPQFVGSDKPTWLGDFNTAMATIDGGMAENKSDIESMDSRVSSAEATASQASQNVSALTTRVGTVESSASSATTTANNAQQTATSALNTANTANGKADTNATNISTLQSEISNFNLTNFSKPSLTKTGGSFTLTGGSVINVATNSDGSLAKIYGVITASNITQSGTVSFQTSLRPTESITITCGCIRAGFSGNTSYPINQIDFTINTNGVVSFNVSSVNVSGETGRYIFINSLIFVKSFGDTPITE